jgi:eukaryotic-like serine/threonine-protein kinase
LAARAIRAEGGGTAQLDRYELIAELAAGGMATVLLARVSGVGGFQRLFAIKRLHAHLAHEQEFVQMFLDEARLAARIHHPNVVPILEVGTSDAGYYLVMEYIEGETLARLVGVSAQGGSRISLRVVARIMLDVLAGLEAAHELRDDDNQPLNLVHRDVSPQNVMVGVEGTSRITDFGVAHAATRLSNTRDGQLKGKLGYMAPEQARGDAVDRRTDIFSVGVMLWEALAGKRLFKGSADTNDAATLNRLLFEPIPSLLEVDPSMDPAWVQLCDRALQRDPDARFASCAQMQDAIEAASQRTGGIASAREVAAFVDATSGTDITTQRAAIKMWSAQSEASRAARGVGDALTLPNVGSSPSAVSARAFPPGGSEISSSSVGAGSAFTPMMARTASRRRLVLLGMLAGMLVIGIPIAVATVLRSGAKHEPPAAPSASFATAASVLPPDLAVSASAAASPDAAAPGSDPAESASSRPGAASSSGGRQSGVNQPGRTTPKGKTPAVRSDEVESNPYR